MPAAARTCPVCNSADVDLVGPILHTHPALVAGVALDLGDTEFTLRGCRACGFQWKDPPIDPAKLMACYAAADADNWQIDPNPQQRRFDVMRGVLEKHARGRRILDVGCFNGALLKYLGDGWQKFGVEPSVAAAALAGSRGVQILAADLDELAASHGPFDVILAVDVVEHVIDPPSFFRRISESLSPAGIFLVVTGDTDSLAWRLQGSAYWYCNLPEHVSFYSRSSLDTLGSLVGMQGIEYLPMCHKRLPRLRWLSDTAKSAVYVAGRSVRGLGVPVLRRWFVDRRGPSIQSARDHLLYVFRRFEDRS